MKIIDMREIKFRAWDNVDYMSTPFTLADIVQHKIEFTSDCKLMQYTGLNDKNGKEIYEGDIVTRPSSNGTKQQMAIGVIAFDTGTFYVDFKTSSSSKITGQIMFHFRECEIIGNIYEHPHLLK